MTNLPAIPSPASLPTIDQINEQGEALVAWVGTTEDVDAINEQVVLWSMLIVYVRETSKNGIAKVEGVKRKVERRIGQLIGPAEHGGSRAKGQVKVNAPIGGLKRHDREDFRKMAAHSGVVDATIDTSNDDSPPTRNKVLAAIEAQEPDRPPKPGDTGESICVRLPLAADAVLRERAETNGVSVARYVTDYLVKAVANLKSDHAAFVAPAPKAAPRATRQPADRAVVSFFKAQKAPKP